MIGWLALGLLVGLFVLLALGARRSWLRQRDADVEAAWREVAADIGHAYSTTDAPHELDRLPLPLLARIEAASVADELTGPSEGGRQRLFTTAIDGHLATVGVADLAREVPDCSLRPRAADGPEVGRGWEPVDPAVAHIGSRFEVRGRDPEAIGSFLDGEIGGWLAGEGSEWAIEMAGNHVLVVHSGLPTERIGEASAVLDAFRARLPWAAEAKTPSLNSGAGDPGPSGGAKRKRRRRRRGGGTSGAGSSGGGGGNQGPNGGAGGG